MGVVIRVVLAHEGAVGPTHGLEIRARRHLQHGVGLLDPQSFAREATLRSALGGPRRRACIGATGPTSCTGGRWVRRRPATMNGVFHLLVGPPLPLGLVLPRAAAADVAARPSPG